MRGFEPSKTAENEENSTIVGGRQPSAQKFGIEELPEKLRSAGFSNAVQLDGRFFRFGFVRGVKPAL